MSLSSRPMAGPGLLGFHHAAVICSDYEKSKRFYVEARRIRG